MYTAVEILTICHSLADVKSNDGTWTATDITFESAINNNLGDLFEGDWLRVRKLTQIMHVRSGIQIH